MAKRSRSKELQEHFDAVAEMGCFITGRLPQLHHAMGGSMRERGVHKGMGQKNSDWLVIPLSEEYHTGKNGIHTIGVIEWEQRYGRQSQMLDEICDRLRVDVWRKERQEREKR